MLFSWTVGFIIPWIAGVFLWKLDRNAIWISAPIAIAVACVINTLGFAFDFWHSIPTTNPQTLFSLPLEIGLYPVTAGYSLLLLRKGVNVWLIVLASSLLLTIVEGLAVLLRYVHYGNGWNIGWTFVSYVLGILIVIGYIWMVSPTSFRNGKVMGILNKRGH